VWLQEAMHASESRDEEKDRQQVEEVRQLSAPGSTGEYLEALSDVERRLRPYDRGGQAGERRGDERHRLQATGPKAVVGVGHVVVLLLRWLRCQER